MEKIHANVTVGISEFKANPSEVIEKADGPIAILNRNKPVAYLIPADQWEAICEFLEDGELAEIISARLSEKAIPVSLDKL